MSSSWEKTKFPTCPKAPYNKSLGHIIIIFHPGGGGGMGSIQTFIGRSCPPLLKSGTRS